MQQLPRETVMKLGEIPESPEERETLLAIFKAFDDAATRGELHGEAEALLVVLEAKGFSVSDEQRARILTCTDEATLKDWIRRAVTAASANDVLG
jgi:hypothetical protein